MSAPGATVGELVLRARAGQRDAFDALYRRFAGAAHAVALSSAPASEAHDIVQDTFVSGWSHLEELREPEAFGAWVLGIARRRAVDFRRRQKRRGGPTDELRESSAAAAPIPTPEAKEALAAILALSETYRETLLMRLMEGMTGPEIADVTGMTPESVRVNLCRGMKLLRERLDGGTR